MNKIENAADQVRKHGLYPNLLKSYIDYDENLNLEKNTLFRKIIDIFFIPLLNNLPKDFKNKIKKTNTSAAEVIDNATNHKALEILYNNGHSLSTQNIGKKIFQNIWFNLNNSKAVRNRLVFVKRELKNYLENATTIDKEINILSIASGSSRAIIETVHAGQYLKNTKLSITFLDKSKDAIEYSKKLSESIDHPNIELEWINDTVGNFLKKPHNKKFDVVEIVGLFDYFTDAKVIETVMGIYNILDNGGIIITANINHNKEEKFITKIIDWPMIYRTAEEFATLVHKGNFSYNKMKVFYEPMRIHGLVVAKK